MCFVLLHETTDSPPNKKQYSQGHDPPNQLARRLPYLRMSHHRACPLSPSTVLQILSMAPSLPVSGDSPTSREKVEPCQYLRRNDTPAASRPGTARAEDDRKKRDFEEVEGDCCAALTAAIPWGVSCYACVSRETIDRGSSRGREIVRTGPITDRGASTKRRQQESRQGEARRRRSGEGQPLPFPGGGGGTVTCLGGVTCAQPKA